MSALPTQRYALPVQALHWLTAAAIVAAWVLALVIDDMPRGPEKAQLIWIHKSLGVSVLLVTAVRLVLRHLLETPALPETMPKLMVLAAKAGHLALYLGMIALPVVGVMMSWSNGRPVDLWGVPLPVLMAENKPLAKMLKEMHEVLGHGFILLAFGHAVAAIYHQYWLKDGVLERMLPWSRPGTPAQA